MLGNFGYTGRRVSVHRQQEAGSSQMSQRSAAANQVGGNSMNSFQSRLKMIRNKSKGRDHSEHNNN